MWIRVPHIVLNPISYKGGTPLFDRGRVWSVQAMGTNMVF